MIFISYFADKKLFTPGPLTSSASVKNAMQRDLGSRDEQFINIVSKIRSELLKVANVDENNWTTVPMQGSGTFSVEAVLQTATPRSNGRVHFFFKSLLNFLLKLSISFEIYVGSHFSKWRLWQAYDESL